MTKQRQAFRLAPEAFHDPQGIKHVQTWNLPDNLPWNTITSFTRSSSADVITVEPTQISDFGRGARLSTLNYLKLHTPKHLSQTHYQIRE
ncbi:hypothetical protein VTL71DRAFT_1128 [Oculimacula yallundae]|uniref:Uncharacterized protein n=1 Tax=Oculimacula yallundae TaxID=86028 RepID=A0ABR4D254_9HELO